MVESDVVSVVIQIGNSDDKLSQRDWSAYQREVGEVVDGFGLPHFEGHSHGCSAYQNACFVLEADRFLVGDLRENLENIRRKYRQDSVALIVGEVEFV